MKDFEFKSKEIPRRIPDSGFYQVELKEYPRLTIAITDLNKRAALEDFNLPKKAFNVTDGEGTNYNYEIAIVHVEDENVSQQELENTIDECWDWLLSDYLL